MWESLWNMQMVSHLLHSWRLKKWSPTFWPRKRIWWMQLPRTIPDSGYFPALQTLRFLRFSFKQIYHLCLLILVFIWWFVIQSGETLLIVSFALWQNEKSFPVFLCFLRKHFLRHNLKKCSYCQGIFPFKQTSNCFLFINNLRNFCMELFSATTSGAIMYCKHINALIAECLMYFCVFDRKLLATWVWNLERLR